MSNFAYIAVDTFGVETRGTLDVNDQSEALRRIKEMGLFPTRVAEAQRVESWRKPGAAREVGQTSRAIHLPWKRSRVKPKVLMIFTRQLATLIEAGMPLLRSLRLLHEQAENPVMKEVVAEVASAIE